MAPRCSVFLVGALVLGGLVYLFTEPLVTAAVHFGKQVPTLVNEAKKGHGPLGRLVFRLHLQKYLSEGLDQAHGSQITKVLKPATAFSVGAAAVSTLVTIVTIAVLTFFTMLEAPRMWRGFLSLFQPSTAERLNRVVDESIRSVTGYMLGNGATSVIAGIISGVTLQILGVPFALLLGVFVALVDLLPLVGGLLAGVPVVVIAAIHSVPAGITMLIVFLVYQQVENHVLNPVIMSKTVQLNPFWVLIAVLVGAALGGRVAGGPGHLRRGPDRDPRRGCHPGDCAGIAAGPDAAGANVEEGVGRGRAGRHLSRPGVPAAPHSWPRNVGRTVSGQVGAGRGRHRARPPLRALQEPARQPHLECLHATAGGHPDL